MALESIVEEMDAVWRTRFETRERRSQRLAKLSRRFSTYTTIDDMQLRELDRIYIRLESDPHRDLYAESIDAIQRLRAPLREQGPRIATSILEAKGTRYTNRFAEITHYLSTNQGTYDDIALSIASLQKNPYVRRRRKRDPVFDAKAKEMERMLEARLHQLATPTRPEADKRAYMADLFGRATVALSGVLCIVAAMPTSIYSLLG